MPRTILITGASSGLGAALAEYYAAPGIVLALTARNGERLNAVAARCTSKGARCAIQTLDVRDTEVLIKWISSINAETPIDLAIVNAGMAGTRASPEEGERPAEMLAQIETNLGGSLLAAQTIGALMYRRGAGQLALISSLNALFPVVEAPTYSATKAGIVAYGRAIRDWLEPAGVHVAIVCPGFVRTGIAERYSGPRPFEISAHQAAAKIATGLARHRHTINFPWLLVAAAQLGKFIPAVIRRRVLTAFTAQLTPLSSDDVDRPSGKD